MYRQPSFYHFSEDSIALANYISTLIIKGNSVSLADLCAGSGVVGIETALKSPEISEIFFLELQEEFIPFIEENTLALIEGVKCTIEQGSLSTIVHSSSTRKFDYIVANPPYFLPGEGRVSPKVNKQLCRTFEVDDFDLLFKAMEQLSHRESRRFFLGRISSKKIQNCLKIKEIELKEKVDEFTGIFELL